MRSPGVAGGGVAMLASVANVEEARIVLRAGADIIDMKQPDEGALGAVPVPVAREIVKQVAGTRLCSATVGNLEADDPRLTEAIHERVRLGVDFVKVGLFSSTPTPAFLHVLQALDIAPVRLIVVLFAEYYPGSPELGSLLSALAAREVAGVMLDTCTKDNVSLPGRLTVAEIAAFIDATHKYGLLCGLAGSLRIEDLRQRVLWRADYLGFRGALCRAACREQTLDPARVDALRARLSAGPVCRHSGSDPAGTIRHASAFSSETGGCAGVDRGA